MMRVTPAQSLSALSTHQTHLSDSSSLLRAAAEWADVTQAAADSSSTV